MKPLNSQERKRKKPFSRRRYKKVENLLVNGTAGEGFPITREKARSQILLLKTRHRKWWSKNPPKDKVLSFKEQMETLFGTEEAIGIIIKTEDGNTTWSVAEFAAIYSDRESDMPATISYLPHGGSACCCTEYAYHIYLTLESDVKIYGFHNTDNPTSRVAREEIHPGGHDFAVVSDRYIVDPWPRLVRRAFEQMVFDMEDPDDAALILDIYGDKSCWERMYAAEQSDRIKLYGEEFNKTKKGVSWVP